MSLYISNGKLLIQNGKLATNNNCCCNCPKCEGSICCNGEYPRTTGTCCEGVWRMPNEGVCCSGIWHAKNTGSSSSSNSIYDEGTCCNDVWYTEPGDCCGNVWYPAPQGKSSPNREVFPFVPVWWETDQCPSGMIYARYGETGNCCGCIPDTVYHPVKTTCYPYSRDNAECYVPTSTVLVPDPDLGNQYPICCDPCTNGLYLKYNYEYGVIGCNGICCAYEDCSSIPESLCNSYSHPTKPGMGSSVYSWRSSGPCCPYGCLTECCQGDALVYKATYEVTGETLPNSKWVLSFPPPGSTVSYDADGYTYGYTLNDVADILSFRAGGTHSGTTITITGTVAHLGTLTYFPPSTIAPTLSISSECWDFGWGAAAKIVSTNSNTGAILDIEVTNGGSGYALLNRTAPTITVSGGSGSGAVFSPVLLAQKESCDKDYWSLSSVSVTGGSGYTNNESLTITVSPGDTQAAQATAIIKTQTTQPTLVLQGNATANISMTDNMDGTWKISSISIINGGSGYVAQPGTDYVNLAVTGGPTTVQQQAANLRGILGRVQPSGYTTEVVKRFWNQSIGSGAVLSPVWIQTTEPYSGGKPIWKVTSININNPGTNYVVGNWIQIRGVTVGIVTSVNANGGILSISTDSNSGSDFPDYWGLFDTNGSILYVDVLAIQGWSWEPGYGWVYNNFPPGGLYYNETGQIKSVQVTNNGVYYREDPSLPPYVSNVTVNIGPSNGSGAILSAVIDNNVSSSTFGQITDITVQDGGSGYTSGELVVSGPTSTTTQINLYECSSFFGRAPRTNGKCPCQPGVRCCETVNSSGSGLRFNRPESLSGTVRVTVTGTTTSPILVHGTLFGANATPKNRCPFTHTFLLCSGSFNIEPTPCNTNFHNLSVEVCYEQATVTAESFNFSGCNNLILSLGNCPYNCVTKMIYSGPGHASNSTIIPGGDIIIEANGTGPLTLISDITLPAIQCLNKITLSGTNTGYNNLFGNITGTGGFSPVNVILEKDGTGTWFFDSNHTGVYRFNLLNGTAIVNRDTSFNYGGPLGDGPIYVGGSYTTGEARLLITLKVLFMDYITVTPGSGQRVIIGAIAENSSNVQNRPKYYGTLVLQREVTLVAPINYTVGFEGRWASDIESNPATTNVRIGHPDFLGTVKLGGDEHITSGIVSVEYGRALLESNFTVLSGSLVQIHGGAELVLAHEDPEWNDPSSISSPLGFVGDNGIISGPGTLNLVSLNIAGDNHIISSLVAINTDSTINGNGNLLISGIISGSSNLTKNGLGTVSLSGNNTNTGTITINSGIMKAESLTAFGTGSIVVNAGGTLDKNGFAITNNIINNGGTVID